MTPRVSSAAEVGSPTGKPVFSLPANCHAGGGGGDRSGGGDGAAAAAGSQSVKKAGKKEDASAPKLSEDEVLKSNRLLTPSVLPVKNNRHGGELAAQQIELEAASHRSATGSRPSPG